MSTSAVKNQVSLWSSVLIFSMSSHGPVLCLLSMCLATLEQSSSQPLDLRIDVHIPNLSSPRISNGSYTLNLRICGSTSESGLPLTRMRPLPCLQCATAVAVFFLPKHCTDCGADIFAVDDRVGLEVLSSLCVESYALGGAGLGFAKFVPRNSCGGLG